MSRAKLSVVVVAAFAAGVLAHASIGDAQAAGYKKLDIFACVLSYVENNYVDPVEEQRLVYGAIKGMLGTLDPHTLFLAPEEYKEMKVDTSGEFGGLGLEIAADEAGLVVMTPLDETPAARAGLQPRDRILRIDAESTKGMSTAAAVRRMRGPPGTRVNLTIMREGFAAPRDFTLLRDRVRIVSVDWRMLEGGVGYVRIKSFQDRTDAYLKKGLDELRRKHGKELTGLVLDLRNNPGGLLDQAIRISDRFLEEGIIVTTQGRSAAQRDVEKAHPAETEPNYPIVVLVNGGSASASEIVAGALQDHRRAVIMGTTSFGKGSVQTVIDLEDGSGLKLTIARYLTPSGRSIQDRGILPDVVVPDAGDVRGRPPGAELEDQQLGKALEALRQGKATPPAKPAAPTTANGHAR